MKNFTDFIIFLFFDTFSNYRSISNTSQTHITNLSLFGSILATLLSTTWPKKSLCTVAQRLNSNKINMTSIMLLYNITQNHQCYMSTLGPASSDKLCLEIGFVLTIDTLKRVYVLTRNVQSYSRQFGIGICCIILCSHQYKKCKCIIRPKGLFGRLDGQLTRSTQDLRIVWNDWRQCALWTKQAKV